MPDRRLILCLTVILGLPLVLGLLPMQSLALTSSDLHISSIAASPGCYPFFFITRTPNTNDGGSGHDYYRLVLVDSTGQIDLVYAGAPAVGGSATIGPTFFPIPPGITPPAPAATYLKLYLYDQTTPNSGDPNGPLVGQSPPFPLPVGCSAGTGKLPSTSGTGNGKAPCPIFFDGRLNSCDSGQTAAIYCLSNGSVQILAINSATSQGYLAVVASAAEIRAVPKNPPKNTLIKQGNGARLYRLTSGELQVNRIEDRTGKDYHFTFKACS